MSVNADKSELLSLLDQLYPQAMAAEAEEQINQLISKYKDLNQPKELATLSENTAMLICYADSFIGADQPSLKTMQYILNRYVDQVIDSLHILPFYPWSSDDGFSVKNLEIVGSDYGSWEDISDLCSSYQVMFDAVINHLSVESSWFQNFLRGDPAFKDFFISVSDSDVEHLNRVVRPRTLPVIHPFRQNDEEVLIWTTFSEDQVDLNYANPAVLLAILSILLKYSQRGAKYLRLDAIAYLWKKLDTACIHLPETHTVIQVIRKVLEESQMPVHLVSETNVPHTENISYLGDGNNEAHIVYNFSLAPLLLHSLYSSDTEALKEWALKLDFPYPNTHFLNFTASHDGIGVTPLNGLVSNENIQDICRRVEELGGHVSMKAIPDGDSVPYELNINWLDAMAIPGDNSEEVTDEMINRFFVTQALILSFRGLPAIYYHGLFGSRGWSEGVELSGIPRRVNREKLNITELEAELSDPKSIRYRIYSIYTELLTIRKQEPAFSPGAGQRILKSPGGGFGLMRTAETGEQVLSLYNFSPDWLEFDIPEDIQDTAILTDLRTNSIERKSRHTLMPYGMVWLKVLMDN